MYDLNGDGSITKEEILGVLLMMVGNEVPDEQLTCIAQRAILEVKSRTIYDLFSHPQVKALTYQPLSYNYFENHFLRQFLLTQLNLMLLIRMLFVFRKLSVVNRFIYCTRTDLKRLQYSLHYLSTVNAKIE